MAILGFIKDINHSGLMDFWKLQEHEIPSSPGAYILIAQGNSHFSYPIGSSPVYYIGQSKNLRSRLREHFKYATQAKHNRQLPLYWPRYEFAAAYGGRYCYMRALQGLSPKVLEEILLAKFAKKHRSFPIANGSGTWKRVGELIENV
jgi:hypothetical protein